MLLLKANIIIIMIIIRNSIFNLQLLDIKNISFDIL